VTLLKRCILILAFSSLLLLILLGCKDKVIVDKDEGGQLGNPIMELTETQSAGDVVYDIEGLKERLLEAQAIELKGLEGDPIGALQNRELIINWVENLFNYPIQEAYPESNQEIEVVGPLNFYFTGDEDIYGLVKKDYIYIEGYYFLITNQQLASMQNQFKANVVEKSVSGD